MTKAIIKVNTFFRNTISKSLDAVSAPTAATRHALFTKAAERT